MGVGCTDDAGLQPDVYVSTTYTTTLKITINSQIFCVGSKGIFQQNAYGKYIFYLHLHYF